ncbi:MAG: hypothetical protein KDE20_08500 [Caldilineaceae bacterium]|nr:hypothetical protein [Caldilineaceae bacterium]MCB9159727.1 hypothetical protein [Caldilineaceae bacterium]
MGPLHLLVLAFDKPNFEGWVVEQLDLLRAAGIIRIVDALAVYKDADGDITALQESDLDLEERIMIGGIIGGLLGLGAGGEEGAVQGALERMEALAENEFGLDEDDILDIADDLPNDSAALILLFEHTWAVGLQEAVLAAGGSVVAQGLLDPFTLMEIGAAMGEDDDYDEYDDE